MSSIPGILARSSSPALPPSLAYTRLLEELETYLAPSMARAVLDDALNESGVSPAEAIPFDLRAIAVDGLPRRLQRALRPDHVNTVLRQIEEVLVAMHAPPRGESDPT